MKSRRASVRIESGLNRVDRAVQLLEDEWRKHGDVHLESFWAQQNRTGAVGSFDSGGMLVEIVKADLRRRFDAGQRPTAAEYLARFPELAQADGKALSVVYEEFCLCEECDGGADVESFCDRYPDWKSSLASQLECHRMISQAAGATTGLPKFPKAGESFEEFQLVARLGKGGTSRVFLARDLSLGGKHVALKVTLDRGEEPKIQGALDHPHIVPVNSVTYQTETRLCALSMPYQPGLPLDEIIKRVEPSRRPARALALWGVLIDGSGGQLSAGSELIPAQSAQTLPSGDGWRGFPARGSYIEGAAWIAMTLARALHYAHGRRIFHRDVKPANILLTVNHGPQLLDFNLAESPHSADNAHAALRGGTLPYMAPEQIEAFLNPDRWAAVGATADIYSLGLVLRELLTGQMPDLPKRGVPAARAMRELLDRRNSIDVAVRRSNPAIPPSLEAIVAKSLALAPADRYTDAESLAADLERFLNHQPLLQAGNPSRRERVGNCLKRQRRRMVRVAMIGAVALLLSAALTRPINQWLTPSFETLPEFQAAVASVHQGQPESAVEMLEGVVAKYPQACLAKIYQAFALDSDADTEEDADAAMHEALALPDAEQAVLAWGQTYAKFCPHLVGFAEARILRADEFAQLYDQDEPGRDKTRDKELRKPSYVLARKALLLAVKLDPGSQKIQQMLAKTEVIFGEYDSSSQRLTRMLESLSGNKNAPLDMLFFCRQLRGRSAFLGVEEKLSQKRASVGEDTVQCLKLALKDLQKCADFLSGSSFGTDGALKQYHVWHDQARATLTLAEVELSLGKRKDAAKHLGDSREFIEMTTARARGLKMPVPTTLSRRLRDAQNRLNDSESGLASGQSRPTPTRSSILGARSG